MGGTREIARALAAVTDHLRRHPEAGRVADRTATVVVTEGLRCRAPARWATWSAPTCRPSWAARTPGFGRLGRAALAGGRRRPPALPVTVELAID